MLRKYILNELISLIFIGFLFNPFYVISQSNTIKFEYLTADDGLSDNLIRTIFRDSKNYIWIGTTDIGLNRYDGYHIKIYKNDENQSGSISSNCIQYIFEDSKENLWIGTRDGLNLYDPKADSFTVFKNDSSDTNSISNNYVTCIFEDKGGNLWIATHHGGGLNKWDYETNRFIHYQIKKTNSDYFWNSFTSMKEDSKGNLWLTSLARGIFRFKPETGDFIHYDDPEIYFGNHLNKKICIDNQDIIWIGSLGSGLYSFDPTNGKFVHFGTDIGDKGLNYNLVNAIIQEDDDHLLIATDQGGINRFNKLTKTFDYIVYDEMNHGLNSNGILNLYKDKEGILWVCTSRGGVNYYNPKGNKFKLISHNILNDNSLSYNIVGCFFEDSDGHIWIGTDGGGVDEYNPKTRTFTNYKHDASDPFSISGNVIRSIYEDKDHDIWIGTWEAGLNRYDKKTRKFQHYFPDKNDSSSISFNTIWHLIVDNNNNIWLGNYYGGIDLLNKKKGVVKRFRADTANSKALSSNFVSLIYQDVQRKIWICTGDGISLYDSITNLFTIYNKFPDNDIRAFCKDKEGKLWAGSMNKGVFLFQPDGTIIKIYDKSNGLPDNTIHAIVEDEHGNLWISTNNGISYFNQKTQKFKNYDKSDGLQGNTFFQQSFLKTRNGEIYFGGYNGFNTFYPDSLKSNDYIPQVYITNFKIFNKHVPFGIPDSPLQYHISETKEITLTWRESVFSFEFTAINYTHPEKNQYAYMMEGFEKEWNYVENKKEATYTNLDPGEYVFKVIASNNDGVWNEEGKSIKIIVTPPFWETWWFRGIIILILSTIIYAIYIIRVSELKKQKIILENEVANRTKELKKAYENIRNTSEFGQKITSTLDFVAINEMINNYIKSFINSFDFGVGIYIPAKKVIEYRMVYEDGVLIRPHERPIVSENSFTIYCFNKQESIIINDLQKEYKTYFSTLPDFTVSRVPNSLINIPLTVKDKKIGVLAVNSIHKNTFDDNALFKLQILAAYIAIALDNVEHYAMLKEKNKLLIEKQEEIIEQSAQLYNTNTILEEHQQHIEEQSEELQAQAEELHIRNNELLESNKTKDKLFSIIAHDIKNPFSSVLGFSDLILNRWDKIDNLKMKHMIKSINSSSKIIFNLLENLLDWSRSQMGRISFNYEKISLYDIVKDNIELMSNVISQKNNDIVIKIPENLYCYADSQTIKAVFRNILTNANKFTENGTITIESEIEKDVIKTVITDTGVGLSEEELETLFEVEKSKSTLGTHGEVGTGLGLIICKDFIVKNGGEIYAESVLNKGVSIIFTLPMYKSFSHNLN